MTEILDIVCKGTVIVGPSYETLDVVCKGVVVIGPRFARSSGPSK